MFSTSESKIQQFDNIDNVRNVCLLAHVDHGKTTLADALLATNNIISQRSAGKMRFMDSLESEQERGITMKSSAVTLIHNMEESTYMINLIDSPGHIDFSSEVSTATRLCDSAILVVDVVEGVCPQTRTVLKQAYEEGLTLVLLINKIDRLILELQLSPEQAFETISRLIEQVNSIIAEHFTSDVTKIDFDQQHESDPDFVLDEEQSGKVHSWSTGLELTNDSDLYFHPELGEVIFGCAIDNWGFRISDFARVWSKKLKIPQDIMTKALWGDFYLAPPSGKTDALKSIKLGAKNKGKPNLFVQCILNQLWNLYEIFIMKKEVTKFQSIAANLNVQVSSKDLKQNDPRSLLRVLLSSWLPLGPSCLDCLVQCCPSPKRALTKYRAIHMLYGDQVPNYRAEDYVEDKIKTRNCHYPLTPICQSIMNCSSASDAPFVAFVSKVFWIEKSKFFRAEATPRVELPGSMQETPNGQCSEPRKDPLTTQNPFASAEFVALSRIFSGSCYAGRRVFVLGPKFDGSRLPEQVLHLDPADLPLGPLKLPSSMQDEPAGGSPSSGSYSGPGLYLRQRSDSASDSGSVVGYLGTSPGSSTSNSWLHQATINTDSQNNRTVRHVYVADIAGVVRFLGGQSDILKVGPGELVPAGSVVGLLGGDLITSLPKSGLLVSSLSMVSSTPVDGKMTSGVVPLAGLTVWHGAPLLSVSLEPGLTTNPDDIVRLERGLRLLERSDPCAEVTVTQRGEYLLHASGELHLQKCLEDFHKYFAPELQVQVSSFCVPYRETVVEAAAPVDSTLDLDQFTEDTRIQAEDRLSRLLRQLNLTDSDDLDDAAPCLDKQPEPVCQVIPMGMLQIPNSQDKTRVYIRVTAHPMPTLFLRWMESRAKNLISGMIKSFKSSNETKHKQSVEKFYEEFRKLLQKLDKEKCEGFQWEALCDQLVAFAPDQTGPNALFSRLRKDVFGLQTAWGLNVHRQDSVGLQLSAHAKALLRGFQIAAESGPLCAEPMRGVVFILEEIFAQKRHVLPVPQRLVEHFQKVESKTTLTKEKQSEKDQPVQSTEDDEIVKLLREKQLAARRREKLKQLDMDWLGEDLLDDDDDEGQEWCEFIDEMEDAQLAPTRNVNAQKSTNFVLNENRQRKPLQPDEEEQDELTDEQNEPSMSVMRKRPEADLKEFQFWSRVGEENKEWLDELSAGYLTPAMTKACILAFQACPAQRLVLAMYDVELQARSEVLGKMYAVLHKRKAQIVSEDVSEGDNLFCIKARLPVIESFGLANDIRKRTSGYVSMPQLRPGGWSVLDIDPLQRAADTGQAAVGEDHRRIAEATKSSKRNKKENSDSDCDSAKTDEINAELARVRRYIREVRMRKGLPTHEQLVVFADKQRTLKKNK